MNEMQPSARTPLVSVIIPAYNVAGYIGDALRSVFAQTFTDYEVIVINDGTPDAPELEAAIAPWRASLVYVVQENRGLSGARNTGIRHARGEFIALLDADDFWEPSYLQVQIEKLRRDPSIDVLYGDAFIFGDDTPKGLRVSDNSPSSGEVTLERLIRHECNVMVSVTARRERLIEVGLFDESLRSSEDFDMWLRIVNAGGRIAYHREPIVHYRRRPGSLSADPVWMYEHILQVFGKVERTMRLTEVETRALREQQEQTRAMLNLMEGKRAFFRGDTAAAISKLRDANRSQRRSKITAAIWLISLAPNLLRRGYEARDRFFFRYNTKV